MTQIMLTPEQLAQVTAADGPVVLVDSRGNRVGRLMPEQDIVFSADRIAEARRRLLSETGGVSTQELTKQFRSAWR